MARISYVAPAAIKDPLARDFYAEMCRIEYWDVRTLRQKIGEPAKLLLQACAFPALEQALGRIGWGVKG